MAGDNISDIIDVDGISTDINKVVGKIDELIKAVDDANKHEVQIRVNLTGADSLIEIKQQLEQVQKNMASYNDVQAEGASISQQFTKSTVQAASSITQMNAELKKVNDAWDKFGRGNPGADKGFQQAIDDITAKYAALGVQVNATTNVLNVNTVALNNSTDSLSKVRQQMVEMVLAGK